jgi:hypothetical protein
MRAWDISFGDVREAPMSEGSFLAGETARNFVFEPPMGLLGTPFITVLEMPPSLNDLRVNADPPHPFMKVEAETKEYVRNFHE